METGKNPPEKLEESRIESKLQQLQLEEPKLSKAAEKKLAKKEAKKAIKQDVQKAPKDSKASVSKLEHPQASAVMDPNAMFQEGWLKAVYNEKPVEHVVSRFPPEPNGYLHIGHSKAIAINFGFARFHGGDCYLRFDDTNPEKEEEKYFVAIQDMIQWLGFTPFRVTYSSDHFDQLYHLAEKLIEKNGAYVCHCSDVEVKKQRGEGIGLPRYSCSHRDRPISESLVEFRGMRDGKYKPREAMLRMKQDMHDGNPQMWDLTAYRILESKHHRTGDKWIIYPTYDFTHCLCDSIENITHSLCTTEFQLSRTSYEWLCDKVEVYRPMQREYGRLNVSGTVLSKRKIARLVDEGVVRGWDDPRLYTLAALRRRGVPPGAILAFVNELGVSTALTNIQLVRFEQTVRRYLEQTVPRLMLVLDPIPVVIDNLADDHMEEIELPFSPKDPSMGNHIVPFTKTIYIDRSDFREVDSKDYFRLAPGKSVGLLKVPYPITATSFHKDAQTGLITQVHAIYEQPNSERPSPKPKTYIQWVAKSTTHQSPISAEVRLFTALFKSENPDTADGGFMNDVRPQSELVYPNACIETGFHEIRGRAPWPVALEGTQEGKQDGTQEEQRQRQREQGQVQNQALKATTNPAGQDASPETVRFQALRLAYFCVDGDSTRDKLILNRIVTLKEDSGKE